MNATIPQSRFDTDNDAETDDTEDLDEMDYRNNDENVTHIDELDIEAEWLVCKLNGDEVKFLINVIQKGDLGASNSSLHKCDELGDPPENIVNRFSTVLGVHFTLWIDQRFPVNIVYSRTSCGRERLTEYISSVQKIKKKSKDL